MTDPTTDPEIEVACPLSNDSSARLADAIHKAISRDGGPLVQDLLDAGATVEDATVYRDAIYATFTVDEADYEAVRRVDRTNGDEDGPPDAPELDSFEGNGV